jgi:periplasmic nitrate reductase NapD
MSILGVIVRTRTDATAALRLRLAGLAGVDVALDPGDGRLILVIEDAADKSAAAYLADINAWPLVLNTSLVYEHSDAQSHCETYAVSDSSDWRKNLNAIEFPEKT